jgi:hypothetical protein
VGHSASLGQIAGADGIGKAANRDTVDLGFELEPAFEAVAKGENHLGVVQGEGGAISASVVRVDFRSSFRFASAEGVEDRASVKLAGRKPLRRSGFCLTLSPTTVSGPNQGAEFGRDDCSNVSRANLKASGSTCTDP